MTVAKAVVPGLTLEKHRQFRENFVAKMNAMDDKLSIVECGEVDGCKAVLQMIKMPMMMTNRTIPNIRYLDESDSELVMVTSSRGTEQLVADQAGVIKKNVVGNNVINYLRLVPTEDGCTFEGVNCGDLAGSIPDMIKKKMAERQQAAQMRMLKVVRDGSLN